MARRPLATGRAVGARR